MVEMLLFGKGLVLGFSVAAPVGPIGILCMDRSLRHGKLSGFSTGMGAAAADTVYGAIAAIGIASVMGFLAGYERELRFVGGLLLLIVAWRMYITPPPVFQQRAPGQKRPLLRLFTESFVLTISNPMTILGFMAVYAGLGIQAGNMQEICVVLAGVFLGSAAWWLSLSVGTVLLRQKLTPKFLERFSRGAGIMIGIFGVIALVQSLFQFRI
jgi:threonine/homoserine/homoserine lactone efflux protein